MSRAAKAPFLRPLVGVGAACALVASAFVAAPAVATAPIPGAAPAAFPPNELTFMAALNYDRARLLADARAISSPGSPRYRNFLTVEQAAARFGASSAQRAALRAAATKLGIKVTFSATGLTANLTAPVGTWMDLYQMNLNAIPSPPWVMAAFVDEAANTYPAAPAALSKHVRLIFASDSILADVAAASSRSQASPASTDDSPPINTGTPFGPGLDCVLPEVKTDVYSPRQLHVPYGTKALHDRGLRGAGARIANLASGYAYSEELSLAAADCFGYRAPNIRFTGGRGVGDTPVQSSELVEGNLDVQVIAPVLPEAAGIDYVEVAPSPWVYQSFIESVDLITTKMTPRPDVVTTSYAECEPRLIGADAQRAVSEDHFALLATVGVTMLAASLDGGSSVCSQEEADPPLALRGNSVAYPASSHWVTGVGGTRIVLGAGNQRVDEVVWNDTPWGGPGQGVGTGGPSLATRPWYQKPVTGEDRRLVPDVSAHASTHPGWGTAIPIESFGGIFVVPFGGTSAAAPFTAANLALIAAAERKAGRGPLGFINPLLYELASKTTSYKRNFYDITKGNNQRFFEASCCVATKGYDQASGLGAPAFDEWIKVIPKPGSRRR
jgi:subtilase family serine protease